MFNFNLMAKIINHGLLSPKFRINKLKNLSSLRQLKEENGFTLVELIVVVMMIGILSSIAIPQFMTAADKAKQKEATGIVAALIKAATAYNTEYGALPSNAGDISEYAKFQKCTDTNVQRDGGKVCKAAQPVPLDPTDTDFYSSSGHYFVEFTDENTDDDGFPIFQVKANPNGSGYVSSGSAVIGCYNPTNSVSEVYEYTAKARTATEGRGAGRNYRPC